MSRATWLVLAASVVAVVVAIAVSFLNNPAKESFKSIKRDPSDEYPDMIFVN